MEIYWPLLQHLLDVSISCYTKLPTAFSFSHKNIVFAAADRDLEKRPFLKLIIVKLEYNSAINRLRVHKGNCFSDTQILPNTYKIFHKYSFCS